MKLVKTKEYGNVVRVESLGIAYFVKNGELQGIPMLRDGSLECECFYVEEVPESEKCTIIEALTMLGLDSSQIAKAINQVAFYEENK